MKDSRIIGKISLSAEDITYLNENNDKYHFYL